MKIAPIAFFCFNRADKTKQVLAALAQNELAKESEIFIFCDAPRNIREVEKVEEVYRVIEASWPFKKTHIFKRKINHGAGRSIIDGINQVLASHDSLIVVEDDILTNKNFLKFLNEGLEFYRDEKNVWCVTGFNLPNNLVKFLSNYAEDIFFVKGKNSSWGWAIWKDRWQKVDFEIADFDSFIKDKNQVKKFNRAGGNMAEMLRFQKEGKIDAWDIQLSYAMFKNDGFCVHPLKTLVKNIGFDASGTHTVSDLNFSDFEFEKFENWRLKKLSEISDNDLAESVYLRFHRDESHLLKWLKSPKKRRNLKWFFAGILSALLLQLIF